jgi:hypothetical protein
VRITLLIIDIDHIGERSMTMNTSTRLAGILFAAALMMLGWIPVISTPAATTTIAALA